MYMKVNLDQSARKREPVNTYHTPISLSLSLSCNMHRAYSGTARLSLIWWLAPTLDEALISQVVSWLVPTTLAGNLRKIKKHSSEI